MRHRADRLVRERSAARGTGGTAERLQRHRPGLDRRRQHLLGETARRPARPGSSPTPSSVRSTPTAAGRPRRPFINNSFVDPARPTRCGPSPAEPRPTRPRCVPPPANGWYWFGAGGTSGAGRNLDVVALRFERTGPGPWDWRWASNHLARFDSQTLKLQKLFPATVRRERPVVRLAAPRAAATPTSTAWRTSAHRSTSMSPGSAATTWPPTGWQYWTGTGWSADETASARVLEGVANEHSVTRWGDGYLLVTHDTTELFSKRVLGYFSCSPTGPFVKPVELYQTPETGAAGSYGDADIITYNSHDHPELRRGNSLLVSYNVNSLDPNNDLYADVSIYRPEVRRASPSAPAAPDERIRWRRTAQPARRPGHGDAGPDRRPASCRPATSSSRSDRWPTGSRSPYRRSGRRCAGWRPPARSSSGTDPVCTSVRTSAGWCSPTRWPRSRRPTGWSSCCRRAR